jgi:ketosteroid isomerase-like protein
VATSASSQTDHLALARHVFAWFEQNDVESFLAALHPDVRAHPSIHGGPMLHGRDAIARWWRQVGELGEDVEARPLDYEQRGDCVIVRGYLRYRDGRTLAESQIFWLYEMRDGLIVRLESHPSRSAAIAACY